MTALFMEKLRILKEIKRSIHGLLWYFAAQGAVLVFLGVVVIFYPQVMILLFAFFFVFAGLLSLWAGWKIWRIVRHFTKYLDLL